KTQKPASPKKNNNKKKAKKTDAPATPAETPAAPQIVESRSDEAGKRLLDSLRGGSSTATPVAAGVSSPVPAPQAQAKPRVVGKPKSSFAPIKPEERSQVKVATTPPPSSVPQNPPFLEEVKYLRTYRQ